MHKKACEILFLPFFILLNHLIYMYICITIYSNFKIENQQI